MEKLLIENFGSLKEIDITLKNLTIFIGKTGTGKSTLAKLIAIFRQPNFLVEIIQGKEIYFEKCLRDYKIDGYLEDNTLIGYVSEWFIVQYNAKLENKIEVSLNFETRKLIEKEIGNNVKDNIQYFKVIEEKITSLIPQNIYIPTERMLLSIFQDGQFDDDLKKIIPNSLSEFGKYWKIASIQLQEYYTSIFNVTYKRKGTEDYVLLPNGKELKLSVSASGMQTLIPALLVLDYYTKDKEDKHSFTFEEPELNLFPTAQKDLVEFLAEKVLNNGHQLVICTHSDHIMYSVLLQCKKFDDTKNNGIYHNATKIYYLKDDECIDIKIEKGGRIRIAPDDFFDQIEKYIHDLL